MKRLIITPLKKELTSLVSVLNGIEKNEYGYLYQDTQLVVGGMGSKKFIKRILKYKEMFSPEEIIVAGSCGSLKDLEVMDIVEVTSVLERDPETQKVEEGKIESNFRLFPDLKAVCCVSGDGNILDKNSKAKLEDCEAEVVTWETASFFKVMRELNMPFSEVRVVTDLADEQGLESFKENLHSGMQKIGLLLKK